MQDSENKVPKLISNRLDIKAETVLSFHHIYDSIARGEIEDISTNAKISLITPQGMISGNIVLSSPYSDEDLDLNDIPTVLESLALKRRNNLLASIEESTEEHLEIVNNSSVVIVRDAVLIPWSNSRDRFNFSFLYVFTADITGFTIGDPIS